MEGYPEYHEKHRLTKYPLALLHTDHESRLNFEEVKAYI